MRLAVGYGVATITVMLWLWWVASRQARRDAVERQVDRIIAGWPSYWRPDDEQWASRHGMTLRSKDTA